MARRIPAMKISFESPLILIEPHTIVKIPIAVSRQLPSRGMVMVKGTLNNLEFQEPLEPDGIGSHWLDISASLIVNGNLEVGQTVTLIIESITQWNEPKIPKDIMNQLIESGLLEQWQMITTKARWSWLRWIRATKNPATRQKRIDVACSKLYKGDRRPCCFDQTKCTVTDVSKSGVLLD